MKSLKRFILTIALLFCIGFPCELFQNYLNQFNNFTTVTFYCSDSKNHNTMLNDIQASASKNHVLVFKVNTSIQSMYRTTIDIYGDDVAVSYLIDQYEINFGTYKSIASGATEIHHYSFSDIPQEIVNDDPRFQIAGNASDMEAFKNELVQEYGGAYPWNSGYDGRKKSKTLTIIIWGLTTILLGIFTFYETLMLKKENFIRITLGENLISIWGKFILSDILFFSVVYGLGLLTAHLFYNHIFLIRYSVLMFGIFLFVDFMMSLNALFYNKNKVLSNTIASQKLLAVNQSMKSISIIVTVLSLASTTSLIGTYHQYCNQKGFYDTYGDYYVVRNLNVMNQGEESFPYEGNFYRNYSEPLNIIYFCQRESLPSSDKAVITANSNTFDYITEQIPELKEVSLSKDVYFFVNADFHLQNEDIEALLPNGNTSYAVISYEKHHNVVAVNLDWDDMPTVWVRDPVIVFFHKDFAMYPELQDDFTLGLKVPLVYSFVKDKDAIDKYMKEKSINYSCTKVSEIFENQSNQLRRTLYISLVLTALMVVLQYLILFSIIKLEYTVNAIELTVKKILGYSIFERFKKHYLSSLLTYILSLIIILTISYILKIAYYQILIHAICTISVCFMDMITHSIYALYYEHKNIQNIIKGGAL